MSPTPSERGQASVELVALLPLLAVVALGVWQAALAGHAAWAAGAAARSAARAAAVGADAEAAAARLLPASLRGGLKVREGADGEVRVAVGVPAVAGEGALTTITTAARFEPQR